MDGHEGVADMTVDEIIAVLRPLRLPLSDENRLQASMADAFSAAALALEREVRLSAEDIIDFFGEGIGIEAKIKGGKMAIYRQLERYAKHDRIEQLILVTNVPTGMPTEIDGKPIYVHNLAMAWL